MGNRVDGWLLVNSLAGVTFDEVGASHPDALHATSRYFIELDARFDGGFEPGDTLTADASSARPAKKPLHGPAPAASHT